MLLSSLFCLTWDSSADIASDREAIDAWMRAGKFVDAAFFCREQLSSSTLQDAERVGYAVELVRVLTAQARAADPATATTVWEAAERAGADWSRQLKDTPSVVLIQFQTALAATTRVETEFHTQAAPPTQLLRQIRQALTQWEAHQQLLERRLRAGGEARGKPQATLGSNLLRSLADRALYGRARLYLCRAALYPAGSDDRVLACRQAIEALEAISPNHVGPIWWDTRVAVLRAARLQQDGARLEAEAKRLLEGPALPTCLAQRVEAERLRLAMQQADWPAVERPLVNGPEGVRGPEWDLAHLEALVALANARGGTTDWSSKTSAQLSRITDRYPAYWQRVADAMVANARNQSAPILSDLATVRLRQGNVVGAIEALDASAEQARSQGEREKAWRLRFEAARLSARLTDWHETMMRAAQLAASAEAPDADVAAEAQLMAIKASAQALRQSNTTTAVYQGHLRRFVDRWPSHPQSDQVRFWLANLYRVQQRWADALGQYRSIGESFSEPIAAVDGIGRCARALGPQHPLWPAALQQLQAISGWPDQATAQAAQLWRLRLQGVEGGPPILATETTPPALRETAEGLGWLQQALAGDFLAARRGLQAFASPDADLWDDLLVELFDRLEQQPADELAQTLMTAVQRAEAQTRATPEQQLRWTLMACLARLQVGDVEEAQQTLRDLQQAQPGNVEVWEAYARALGEGDAADQQQAVEQWQRFVRSVPKASPAWYRGKYSLAALHARLGNREAARKTVALTRTLHPELGGEPWATKFKELEARLTE
ncbi:MAG: hypothetical protein AAGF97_01630 [Planctomycetota bacterium]